MNRDQKLALIKNWLTENQLFYQINPNDEDVIEDYIFALGSKMPELYKLLRKNNLIPKNSYKELVSLVEDNFIIARHKAIFY